MLNEANCLPKNVFAARAGRKAELVPAHVETLKKIFPHQTGECHWPVLMARDALYDQELRRGRSPEEARRIAAQRLLNSHAGYLCDL